MEVSSAYRRRVSYMKILQLTWCRLESYGGLESHLVRLARAFTTRGVECETLMLPSLSPYHLQQPGDQPRLPLWRFPDTLERIIREGSVDIVHTHNIARPYAPGIPEAVAEVASRTGRPHVTTIHDIGGQPPS